MRSLRMARISVKELRRLQLDGLEPLVIDVRSMVSQRAGRIPGAVAIPNDDIETFVLEGLDGREVVLYCSCPSDASAAVVAKKIMEKGVRHVRPLAGGIEAWISEGHSLEEQVTE
jgi:rhodanese-related sulfurtransferase